MQKINLNRHVKPVLALFLPQAASTVYVQFDKIMLGMMSSDIAYVTIYEKAETIAKLPLKFVTALSAVVLPKTAGLYATNNREEIQKLLSTVTNVTILLVLPAMIGLILVADIFIPAYLGYEYIESTGVLQILAISVVAISLSNITGVQYLMATDSTKILTASYLVAAIANCVLNYFLIKAYNANGAAIATLVAEWLVFTIQYKYMLKKGINLNILKCLGKRGIGLLVMTTVVLVTRTILGVNLLSGIAQIGMGAIGYLVTLILLKDQVVLNILQRR